MTRGVTDGLPKHSRCSKSRAPCEETRRDLANFRQRTYGLSHEAAFKLWLGQDCRCAICRKKGKLEELHVDHDHNTGKVRGFLCPSCNLLLGRIEGNEDLLYDMFKYLGW